MAASSRILTSSRWTKGAGNLTCGGMLGSKSTTAEDTGATTKWTGRQQTPKLHYQSIACNGDAPMPVTRQLTIAGMRGRFALRFRDVANLDAQFQSHCGGLITVRRSLVPANGTTYIIVSDTDHFRVFAKIITPDVLPTVYYWDDCNAYGWWVLDGYEQKTFEAGNWLSGEETLETLDMDALSSDKLGEPKEANQAGEMSAL